ncbi:NAD-P-binding protein [Panus rudis PR-1116 ss-1]|nr:NAD-P-binding protein [Panus rudis PR-1116 ss-1]
MSSAAKTSIFITGATGYLGGSVLSCLLTHPSASNFEITAIVRSPEKANMLENFGVKTVIASLDDVDKIEKLASQCHVVFSCADADHILSIKTILRGLEKRHATTGDRPVLIHTSGAAIFGDDARGLYASETIWDDSDYKRIAAIPETALHRDVDTAIVKADEAGYLRSYIVVPGTVYGMATGPLVEAGIANPHSLAIPYMIKTAIARGRAPVVGKGLAKWAGVHIEDMADLYITLFDALLRNPENVGHGVDGFYVGESGEYSWLDISKAIGEALAALGVIKDPEPTPLTTDELIMYFGSEERGLIGGTNARARGTHSRSIGWKPKYTTDDMLASIMPEAQAILKELADQKSV